MLHVLGVMAPALALCALKPRAMKPPTDDPTDIDAYQVETGQVYQSAPGSLVREGTDRLVGTH